MNYFNGFSLTNEQELFKEFFLENINTFTLVGFSYGAIKAIEYALNKKSRIDKIILLSPAFFNDKDEKFKKMQLIFFAKNKEKYINNFLDNISNKDKSIYKYKKEGSKRELKELLYYEWKEEKIKYLLEKGIEIEVFLGEKDKIINSNKALEFFQNLTTTYFIKNANHILKEVKND